jgi:hypothetical protein
MSQSQRSSDDEERVVTTSQLKRERLRFVDFKFGRTPQGACNAEVELEWLDGMRVQGKATGTSSELGDLRCAAEAAIDAIEKFSEGALELELLGVKALRAFDANIVIVSVEVKRGEGPRRLLGSYLAEQDAIRASVVAVLNATNRVLGNFIATR